MGRKILVGTDTSPSADLAVGAAAELLVLLVRSEDGGRDLADPRKPPDPQGYLARMARRFPSLRVRSWSDPGDPAERICDVAAEEAVETIVLGNKGVRGWRWRVRESVPNLVLRHAPCSVLIVDTRVAH